MKYPYIQDYNMTLQCIDYNHYTDLKYSLYDIEQYYIILYDLCNKNDTKIREPRGSNHHKAMI